MPNSSTDLPWDDPITKPFWDATRDGLFLLQVCEACTAHQFYPRSLCAHCSGQRLRWAPASGRAVVYAVTTVRPGLISEHEDAFQVGLVTLAEGPRVMTRFSGPPVAIGQNVKLDWFSRPDDLPPLYIFSAGVDDG